MVVSPVVPRWPVVEGLVEVRRPPVRCVAAVRLEAVLAIVTITGGLAPTEAEPAPAPVGSFKICLVDESPMIAGVTDIIALTGFVPLVRPLAMARDKPSEYATPLAALALGLRRRCGDGRALRFTRRHEVTRPVRKIAVQRIGVRLQFPLQRVRVPGDRCRLQHRVATRRIT